MAGRAPPAPPTPRRPPPPPPGGRGLGRGDSRRPPNYDYGDGIGRGAHITRLRPAPQTRPPRPGQGGRGGGPRTSSPRHSPERFQDSAADTSFVTATSHLDTTSVESRLADVTLDLGGSQASFISARSRLDTTLESRLPDPDVIMINPRRSNLSEVDLDSTATTTEGAPPTDPSRRGFGRGVLDSRGFITHSSSETDISFGSRELGQGRGTTRRRPPPAAQPLELTSSSDSPSDYSALGARPRAPIPQGPPLAEDLGSEIAPPEDTTPTNPNETVSSDGKNASHVQLVGHDGKRAPILAPDHLGVCQFYRGEGGKKIMTPTNYLRLAIAKDKGIHEYEVRFNPQIDDRDQRFRLVNQQRELIGPVKLFDAYKLFLPIILADPVTTVLSTHTVTGEKIELQFIYKCERKKEERDCIQLYNILFNKIFRILNYQQHNRKFYNPSKAEQIPKHRLQVWPGYVTAADRYEGDLLLQIDVSHRVVRNETARELLMDLVKRHGSTNLKNEAEKAMLGCSVTTKYNNKTYKIDDLDFNANPKSTFTNSKGEQISYVDYYKKQYGIEIKDLQQPLLVHRPNKKATNEAEMDKLICLIPELCLLTGLTDKMRADFQVMKAVGDITRAPPAGRIQAMTSFVASIRENEEASALLKSWGLMINNKPHTIQSRQLQPEILEFGNKYKERINEKCDWGRTATSRPVVEAVDLDDWLLLFLDRDKVVVQQFVKKLMSQALRMGMTIREPKVIALPQDRTEVYLKAIRQNITDQTQLAMTVVPAQKSDRYAAIKKLCYVEKPLASQVLCTRTISKEKTQMSVAQKVALQLNCKLGGQLWTCDTPHKGIMIVGIDVFHSQKGGAGSIAGVVASVNDETSRFFSTVAMQRKGQELMDAICVAFVDALIHYHDTNGVLPKSIVVFRDGVGDGQLEATRHHEVPQFLNSFKIMAPKPAMPGEPKDAAEKRATLHRILGTFGKPYKPSFNYVVVQKRINTRIFYQKIVNGQKSGPPVNPPPGTLVDSEITRWAYKDFFLIPQVVNQGTVTPTHFIVLAEEGPNFLKADEMQQLSYRMTHMYYNWPGTVRVPAPCQYAHKLVDMVGENLRCEPCTELCDKLFYL